MLSILSNFLGRLSVLHSDESGQDLIEYALVAALLTLAAVAGLPQVASAITSAFSRMASSLSSLST
jgi:pilus assembly protein Flp/PilA